ncbi:DUF2782 domain-containing protein [Chromatium okenii]|uniref:DUF2782 domain-containing protein n=1 Tax=Chromatium okenii TaxID=61644 RepID=UPI003084131A
MISLRNRILFTVLFALTSANAAAQSDAAAPDDAATTGGGFLQAPSVEPSPLTDDAVEPDITITESGATTVYEYRVRGALYMIRVQPQVGPAYYFYDVNGDGTIDAQERSARNTAVPQWELLHWN